MALLVPRLNIKQHEIDLFQLIVAEAIAEKAVRV
jgi:hypothetical protein